MKENTNNNTNTVLFLTLSLNSIIVFCWKDHKNNDNKAMNIIILYVSKIITYFSCLKQKKVPNFATKSVFYIRKIYID